MACSRFAERCSAVKQCASSRKRDVMMRPLHRLTLVFFVVVPLAGCSTARVFQPFRTTAEVSSPQRNRDSLENSESSDTNVPPPPVPAAYGVSYTKSIGFRRDIGNSNEACAEPRLPFLNRNLPGWVSRLKCCRLFSRTDHQSDCAEVSCTDDVCVSNQCCKTKDDCCDQDSACDNSCTSTVDGCTDRVVCGGNEDVCAQQQSPTEILDYSLLDETQGQPAIQPNVPEASDHISASPQPAVLAPLVGISAQRVSGAYFRTELSIQNEIVEPPLWRGGRTRAVPYNHNSITAETVRTWLPQSQTPIHVRIRPRQNPAHEKAAKSGAETREFPID